VNGVERVEVRSGSYHDSVTLMQVSRAVAATPGVLAAQVAMGTDLNVDVLVGMGFTLPAGITPSDLVVALRAQDDAALEVALAAVAAELAPRRPVAGSGPAVVPPATLGTALAASGAGLALVSVPGEHAFTEAMDALDAGAHVMVFSDNVPVAQEVRLKEAAAERGLLVMGPDCGTAVVSGVGLGFANVVRPGPVGVVAASGTGAQQVMSLLDAAGVGVRHCLGVGGRDLSDAVGGRSARTALGLLAADPSVEVVLLVSKPAAPQVEQALEPVLAGLGRPVVTATLGPGRPTLTDAVRQAVAVLGLPWTQPQWWPAPVERAGRYTALRGAFSGGTLADEAMLVAAQVLGPLPSNIPLTGADGVVAPRLGRDLAPLPGSPHAVVDFGDDELTLGRPHPMIDGTLRAEWLVRQGDADAPADGAAVVLLDVVLGHGAHPDPAAELAAAIAELRRRSAARGAQAAVVVSLCGTRDDPQGLERQAAALVAAGASVHLSNAAAARKAVELLADDVRGPLPWPAEEDQA
jgi:FdrA protein